MLLRDRATDITAHVCRDVRAWYLPHTGYAGKGWTRTALSNRRGIRKESLRGVRSGGTLCNPSTQEGEAKG